MKRPGKTQGLRHVALFVPDLVVAEHFFRGPDGHDR